MRRFWTLGTAFLVAMVLAACTVTVTPTDPFPGALPVTAVDNPATAVVSSSVGANGSEVYVVTVPSAVISGDDVIFFELAPNTAGLGIVVYNSNGSAVASSSSKEIFRSGKAAVSLIDPTGIGVTVPCRGPCVLLPAVAGTYYVEILNETSSSQDYDLYVFGDDFVDAGEPGNNSSSTALSLSPGVAEGGAIETLGDVDYFSVAANGLLQFDSGSPLDLVAEVLFNNMVQETLQPGGSVAVFTGDIVRVTENGSNAAGPSATSNYALTMTSSSPFPGAEMISAGTSPNTPADSDSVAGSSTKVYQVDVSGGAAASELLYFELDTENAAVVVYNSGGTALASSTNKLRFVAGGSAAARFSTSGITTAITTQVDCRGSCVILEAASGTYFVEVINETSSPLSFDFFAFGDVYGDDNEPGNDVPASATSLSSSETGAIETLGDDDYFDVTTAGTLTFSSASTLDLRAEVRDSGDVVVATLSPGQTFTVLDGDLVRVYEAGDDAAGPSASSFYSLGIE